MEMVDSENEELLSVFFEEAQMLVDTLEENILSLEDDPHNPETIDEIFRAAHTLKGGSATVEMNELAGFTHIVEDVFDVIRDNKIKVNNELIDVLLTSLDVIKEMLFNRINGNVYDKDVEDLKSRLRSFLNSENSDMELLETGKGELGGVLVSKIVDKYLLSTSDLNDIKESVGINQKVQKISLYFNPSNPMSTISGLQMFSMLKDLGPILHTVPDYDELLEDKFFERVDYYLIFEDEMEIVKKVNLSDVILKADIKEFNIDEELNNLSNVNLEMQELNQHSLAQETVSIENLDETVYKDSETQEKHNVKKNTPLNIVSLIRVDSKRIDHILNLVSEAVISKSVYNQINSDMMLNFSNLNSFYDQTEDFQKNFVKNLQESLASKEKDLSLELEKEIKKLLDHKMQFLFSDLISIRNTFISNVQNLKLASQRFSRIIADLHESVLKTRMLPVSNIFSRFPRMVRDLSKKLDKSVEITTEGEDTELDKSVIDDLVDPLMHCIRNSMDHGLETKEERKKRGKNEIGSIILRAKNEGNIISIEIEDDGKGIDPNIIRAKLIEKGIILPDASMLESEIINLIFEPGFSTASQITSVSGRGVGLDVVKRNIEKLNGSIEISSQLNIGTIFKIKLPLTLVIIQGLLVKTGDEIYIVPLASVLETHRICEKDIRFIENGYEVYNLREEVISILRLNNLFGIKESIGIKDKFLIVVSTQDKKVGILVDSIIGEEDVVVKPLKSRFAATPGITGATTLGNGKVVLIIDVLKLLGIKT